MNPRLRIDLDAFADNLAVVRREVAPAGHMLVVKDDAYGHGLRAIVQRAHREGIRWIGAFDVPTGLQVRELLGADARIFVWLVPGMDAAQAAVGGDLDIGVGDEALLEDVAVAAARRGRAARVHLKIDTGLHRNGIRPERWEAVVARAAALTAAGRVRVEGVWSHIAEASDAEDDEARDVYEWALGIAAAAGAAPRVRHLAASAAGFARPEFRYDLTRIGAFAYGIRSAGGPGEDELGLRPIASVAASVTAVVDGRVHVALGSMHGLPSVLAGLFSVDTPAGARRVTRIESDHCVIESWPGAVRGDRVHVVGAQAPHTVTDLAERIGSIGEEIALRLYPALVPEYTGEH